MSHADELAFKTMPRPPRRASIRKPTRFQIWAWSPVLSFQVGLTASYLAAIYFGISSVIATAPAFQETAPHWYQFFWAVALVLGGCFGAVGSVSRHKAFERIELAGVSLVSLTCGSYAAVLLFIAYGLGDTTRISGAAGFVTLVVPFLVRTLWLSSQMFRK